MQAAGGMRTDYDPADAPWSRDDLARNLERIAFFTEFALEDGALVPRETETSLLKWDGPIRYRIVGDSVTVQDVQTYAGLARRLSAVTGLAIEPATGEDAGNMLVLILSRDARRTAAAYLEREGGPSRAGLVYRLRTDDYAIPCAASVRTEGPGSAIVYGVIVVKAETSGLLRESCAHEEFAQALGPGNDYDFARPSIFNDDQEFALITAHDEALLRVLYDSRLEPGMSRAEAMPVVREIVAGLDLRRPSRAGERQAMR